MSISQVVSFGRKGCVIMKTSHQKMIALFQDNGIDGIDIVNELLRFRVLDQMISSHPATKEWGITADKLFSLAHEATVQSFGEISYAIDTFEKLYGPSFSVDVMDFISDTGIIEGMNAGCQWKTPLMAYINQYKAESNTTILFAYVEEYTSLIEDILQAFGKKRVVLYTASEVCYSVLSRLYPLATIVNEWPSATYFDHIVTATVGMYQDSEHIMEEVANGMNNLSKYGTAHLFLPLTAIQNQTGLNRMALQFFLGQKKLERVREWTPIGTYEFVFGPSEVKKMKAEICEIIDDTYRTTPFIALPHEVFSELEVFSLVGYGLSLCSVILPGTSNDLAMGQEGLYCRDARLPERIIDHLVEEDAWYLTCERNGLSINFGLTDEKPEDLSFWMFPSQAIAYMWFAYFTCDRGRDIAGRLAEMVLSEDAFCQLISSCRRRRVSDTEKNDIIETLDTAEKRYADTLRKAETNYDQLLEQLGEHILP